MAKCHVIKDGALVRTLPISNKAPIYHDVSFASNHNSIVVGFHLSTYWIALVLQLHLVSNQLTNFLVVGQDINNVGVECC